MIADSVADLLLPYVIFPEPEPVRSGLIELNGADSATLRSVVGIGEKSVMAIIRYRERLGGFTAWISWPRFRRSRSPISSGS